MIPTHITLVPPTEIDDVHLTEVEKHLEEVAAERQTLLRPPARHRHLPPGLAGRVRDAGRGHLPVRAARPAVRRGPLDVDLQFPYHPHVTVAHHLEDPLLDRAFDELADFECEFDVDGFHLYVHDDEPAGSPRRDFPLRPPRD